MRQGISEKGKMTINGKEMRWEMIRSKSPSAFGIHGSRIFELNLYRDGTIVADYNKRWLTPVSSEDEEANLCLSYLIERYGGEKKKKEKKDERKEEDIA